MYELNNIISLYHKPITTPTSKFPKLKMYLTYILIMFTFLTLVQNKQYTNHPDLP